MPDAKNPKTAGITAREACQMLAAAPFDELKCLIDAYSDDTRKQVSTAVTRAKRRYEKLAAERARVEGMYAYQRELGGDGIVLGLDEVGRGSVAGPLTVCAVALPYDPIIYGLNDSKQLTPERREEVAALVAENALAIGIAHIEPASIDAVGMATALRVAMSRAIVDSGVEPDAVLIDGNPLHVHPKERNVVKGDARVACIAAASIVAKVTRDALMVSLDEEYPGYHLAQSKGYASPEHIAAIREKGLTEIHRASFCGNFVETQLRF